jgi:hypothetical protein
VELNDKKDLILRLLALGMAMDKAMLYAEIDEEDLIVLNQDEVFGRRVKRIHSETEYELLKKFDEVMDISSKAGRSEDIKWKLALINRDRYGNVTGGKGAGDVDPKAKASMKFTFSEGSMSLEADNVEVGVARKTPLDEKTDEL